MDRRQFVQGASLIAVAPALARNGFSQHADAATMPQWLRDFAEPPDTARPWVYAFWMEGNITREGIRADLHAMKEQGIGGMLFMDGALNNPSGPERFLSDSWIELFVFMVEEADRLGLEINLNNAPGWAGSGGPWITPEYATKRVIIAENVVQGGSPITAPLSKPAGIRHDYYKDIAVLAYPLGGAGLPTFRIPNIGSTKSFAGDEDFFGVVPWPRFIPTNTAWPEPPADQTIPSAKMIDLTQHFDANGTLHWTPPDGRWLLLRIGYTVANGATRSTQPEATGLECDKLSKAAVERQFHSMVARLSDKVQPLIGKA